MPEDARNVILYGSGEEVITFQYDDGLRNYKTRKAFEGVIPNLERAIAKPTAVGRAKK